MGIERNEVEIESERDNKAKHDKVKLGIERKEESRTKRNDGMGIERNEVEFESERDDKSNHDKVKVGTERKEESRTKRNDGMGIVRNNVEFESERDDKANHDKVKVGIERKDESRTKFESERDNEILLMLQDNDQLEPDEKLMNILDKEKLDNIEHELEQDEELLHEYEKSQLEDDILYELKDANERIMIMKI
jgi:hypothetical protein